MPSSPLARMLQPAMVHPLPTVMPVAPLLYDVHPVNVHPPLAFMPWTVLS